MPSFVFWVLLWCFFIALTGFAALVWLTAYESIDRDKKQIQQDDKHPQG